MRFIFYLLTLITSTVTFSQVQTDSIAKSNDGYFQLFGGAGFPVFDFASSFVNDDDAGWAEIGMTYGISYDYTISNYLRIIGLFKYSKNKRDAAIAGETATQTSPGYFITATSDPWKVKMTGVGLIFSRPLGRTKKFYFDFMAMPGIAFVTFPELKYTVKEIQSNTVELVTIKESLSKTFAYSVGLKIKYKISASILIYLMADYLGSNPKFEYQVVGSGTISPYLGYNFNKKIQLFSCTLGIGVRVQ